MRFWFSQGVTQRGQQIPWAYRWKVWIMFEVQFDLLRLILQVVRYLPFFDCQLAPPLLTCKKNHLLQCHHHRHHRPPRRCNLIPLHLLQHSFYYLLPILHFPLPLLHSPPLHLNHLHHLLPPLPLLHSLLPHYDLLHSRNLLNLNFLPHPHFFLLLPFHLSSSTSSYQQ